MQVTPSEKYLKHITAQEGIIHKVVGLYADGKEDKEDLYQEILLQAWRNFGKFRAEAQFSTWLYRVTLKTALNFRRKYQKTENLEKVRELTQEESSDKGE